MIDEILWGLWIHLRNVSQIHTIHSTKRWPSKYNRKGQKTDHIRSTSPSFCPFYKSSNLGIHSTPFFRYTLHSTLSRPRSTQRPCHRRCHAVGLRGTGTAEPADWFVWTPRQSWTRHRDVVVITNNRLFLFCVTGDWFGLCVCACVRVYVFPCICVVSR